MFEAAIHETLEDTAIFLKVLDPLLKLVTYSAEAWRMTLEVHPVVLGCVEVIQVFHVEGKDVGDWEWIG